jgi:hypothetical protein
MFRDPICCHTFGLLTHKTTCFIPQAAHSCFLNNM